MRSRAGTIPRDAAARTADRGKMGTVLAELDDLNIISAASLVVNF